MSITVNQMSLATNLISQIYLPNLHKLLSVFLVKIIIICLTRGIFQETNSKYISVKCAKHIIIILHEALQGSNEISTRFTHNKLGIIKHKSAIHTSLNNTMFEGLFVSKITPITYIIYKTIVTLISTFFYLLPSKSFNKSNLRVTFI